MANYYSRKQIEKAREMDLLTYLQTYEPTELVHIRGNTYCTREHDSLKISKMDVVEQRLWRSYCPGLSDQSQRHEFYGCDEDTD